MTTLAIGLIVIGVALVCGGLILWPRAPQREHENQADGTMADVSRRVDESSDAMDSPSHRRKYSPRGTMTPELINELVAVLCDDLYIEVHTAERYPPLVAFL